MVNNNYANAYTEVIEIISHFSKEDLDRIPSEKIKFYKDNMNADYKFTINPEIDLDKQNISKEANAIIVTLYRDYFATEEQKEKIQEILKLNQVKFENEKREKFKPDDIFKTKVEDNNISKENNLPMEIKKENFFTKFINYIKHLFSSNKN